MVAESKFEIVFLARKCIIGSLYRIISFGGKAGISRSELYRRSNMVSDDLDRLIGALIRQDRIEQITDRHTGGRPRVTYRIIE